MQERQELAIGIDLGTTCSVIARLDELGRPQTVANAEGERLTPSAVFFEGDTVIVGREALRAHGSDPQNVALHAKRELGKRSYPQTLGGRYYPAEAIQAWILNKLRLDAARQIGSFQKVVITVPAYFDEVRRKATEDAAYMAGLEAIDIINEPTAAALAFGYRLRGEEPNNAERRRLLVYDLGGGTFDVTALEMDGGGFTVIATDGDFHLGGYDWDRRLLDHLAEEFRAGFSADPRDDSVTAARWWRECEEVKRTLAVRQKATFVCDCQGEAWRRDVQRMEFERWTQDLLDRTRFTLSETVAASGLGWSDFDDILLVGGSTRMPAVQAMLRDVSGRELNATMSPDEAVAHDAALRAGYLLQQAAARPQVSIRDVNSHSLGVSGTDSLTRQPRVAILIPRNSPLPASARRVFKTQKDGQRSVLIPVLEGESATPTECVALGQCVVQDLPDDLPAQTPVEVCFKYRPDGRLTLKVHIVGTERELRHEIIRENSLSDEQLNAWRAHIAKLPADE